MRRFLPAFLVAVAVLVAAAPAGADPVADAIRQELIQGGVPNVSVSVVTPDAATASDAATFANDPSTVPATINPVNALSTDPADPDPVVTVRFGSTTGMQTPGTLTPPSEPGSFMNDAQTALWDSMIMQAVKHATADGAPIAGVIAYSQPLPLRDTEEPAVYTPTPDPEEFPATPTGQTVQTMATNTVQVSYSMGLPPQYAGAAVSVIDNPGGQRTVTITYDQPASRFATDDLSDLSDYAAAKQIELNDPLQGANIGQVVVTSHDTDAASATYGKTVFTRATDVTWGEQFDWAAPNVAAFTDEMASDQADS